MTSGRQPPPPRQLTPKRDGNEPREGGADEETREMMTRQTGPDSVENAGLDTRLQAQIGLKLKQMFDEVANAPVPDKFIDLLKQLDGQEKSK